MLFLSGSIKVFLCFYFSEILSQQFLGMEFIGLSLFQFHSPCESVHLYILSHMGSVQLLFLQILFLLQLLLHSFWHATDTNVRFLLLYFRSLRLSSYFFPSIFFLLFRLIKSIDLCLSLLTNSILRHLHSTTKAIELNIFNTFCYWICRYYDFHL